MSDTSIVLTEQNLLVLCYKNPSYTSEIDPSFFITNEAKLLHESFVSLLDSNIEFNNRNILMEVSKRTEFFNELTLEKLFNIKIDNTDFEYNYSSLKKSFAQHQIQTVLIEKTLKEVTKKGQLNVNNLKELRDLLSDHIDIITDDNKKIFTAEDMLSIYHHTLLERNEGHSFYDTGCGYLNMHLTEGFVPSKITVLFGASGVGKSSYALYLVNSQINKQIPSLYISLEMDLISTMDRLIAQRNKILISDLIPRPGKDEYIQDYVFDLIKSEQIKLNNSKYFRFVEEPGLSISDIEHIIKKVKRQLNTNYLVVTIDLLTMVKEFNKSAKKADDYEHAMNELHELVKRQKVHLVGVVQARRPSEKVSVKEINDVDKFRPSIETIKNSSAIEERSRTILSTFRRKFYMEKYFPDDPEVLITEDIMEIDVLKQNMGSLGRLKYLFKPETSNIYKYIEVVS